VNKDKPQIQLVPQIRPRPERRILQGTELDRRGEREVQAVLELIVLEVALET
jgi:hypothetical protein